MDTHNVTIPQFNFDNSFASTLEGFFVPCEAAPAPSPRLLQLNHGLAAELGLDADMLDTALGAEIFSGNLVPDGAVPLAQVYAGHQFGGFSPQLGDGRALLLGEIVDTNQHRRDIQLKGSGRTPFSRNGDGKAALGPILREYLMGEAMHALSIPTTRALAAVTTGDFVQRETPLPAAVLTRVAASHLRVGTFEFFAAREETDKVKQLADYAIARHYPEALSAENPYLAFFKAVANAQAALIAGWMNVGFIHGVMNTDNMTISGETIDYGPCAFMDAYAPGTVFSSIDMQGRYAYANQPSIGQWNLTRLAETLILLVDPDIDQAKDLLTDAINAFPVIYDNYWLKGMRAKIGLTTEEDSDRDLVNGLLAVMEQAGADYTLVFRRLSHSLLGDEIIVETLFGDSDDFKVWSSQWRTRLQKETISPEGRAESMDRVNPIYIPRNHKVEEALTAAVEHEDMTAFSTLLDLLSHPFDEDEKKEAFTSPAPANPVPYQTFCGT
jgi:serine/tyrosine/threonine adenylyltransferase